MDPKDKEIADLKEQVQKLTTQVTTVTGERDVATKDRDTFKQANEKLGEDLKAKDTLISEKNKAIVGTRKKYSEMKPEEKDELTEAEKLALESQEETAKRLDDIEKSRLEDQKRLRDSAIDTEINRYTNKPDIQTKIKANLARLADFGKALTPQEIAAGVKTGIDMLGTLTPGTLNQVINAPGGEAPGDSSKKEDFADTEQGQKILGIIAPQAVNKPAASAK